MDDRIPRHIMLPGKFARRRQLETRPQAPADDLFAQLLDNLRLQTSAGLARQAKLDEHSRFPIWPLAAASRPIGRRAILAISSYI